jgi:hypothetical protein
VDCLPLDLKFGGAFQVEGLDSAIKLILRQDQTNSVATKILAPIPVAGAHPSGVCMTATIDHCTPELQRQVLGASSTREKKRDFCPT